jgi:hypothetical protein
MVESMRLSDSHETKKLFEHGSERLALGGFFREVEHFEGRNQQTGIF